MKNIDSLISKYRTEVMGIASVMIMFGHTVFWGNISYGVFTPIVTLGYCGVDIFLFLSGFGLFYSMQKGKSIKSFYCKRLLRILPTFLCVMILYSILNYKTWSLVWFVNPMTWYYAYWYVPFILLMYLVYPFVYNSLLKWNKYWTLSAIVIISILFLFILIDNKMAVNHSVFMCSAARIPIFFIGMFWASGKLTCLRNKILATIFFILGVGTLIGFYFWDNLQGVKFTTYYCFILIIPILVYWLSLACSIIGRNIRRFVLFSGNISLELYLIHVTIVPYLMSKFISMGLNSFWVVGVPFLIAYILSYICSVVTHLAVNTTLNKYYDKSK